MNVHMEYYVVLVFDHSVGRLVELREFGSDEERAVQAYAEVEAQHDSMTMEVVLIGSDSLATVKQTHANYFEAERPTSKYLAGI